MEFLCHSRLEGAPGVEPVQVDAVVREPGKASNVGAFIIRIGSWGPLD